MASIFTIKYGVGSSARRVEAKGSLMTGESVDQIFMTTHYIIHVTLPRGG